MVYLLIFHDRTGRYMSNFFFSIDSAVDYYRNVIRSYKGWRLFRVIEYKDGAEFNKNFDASMYSFGLPNHY